MDKKLKVCFDCINCDQCPTGLACSANSACKMFKDKSEWVHLPCKVGDEVYFVDASHYRCDAEDCYCCDNEGDIESKYDRHICEFAKFTPSVVEMKMRNINDIFHWFPYFGKTIFLTREEAEKSIEDMRKEDEGK